MTTQKFMLGEQVRLTGCGGVEEIGTVVPSETGHTRGVWVFSPTKRYASDYALHNVKKIVTLPIDPDDKMIAYFKEVLILLRGINSSLKLIASYVRKQYHRHGDKYSLSTKHWNDNP